MILVALIFLCVFAACGFSDGDDSANSVDKNDTVKESTAPVDTVYDVGEITVAVPEGWKAFNNIDIHAEDPCTISKNSINICKGGVVDTDIFTKPYIKLDYRGKDIYLAAPIKLFYDNVIDITPFELGGRTWEGFSCDSLGYPIIMLYIDEGNDQYMVTISCGQSDDAISLEDEEVRRIIASLTVKESAFGNESAEDSSAETTVE